MEQLLKEIQSLVSKLKQKLYDNGDSFNIITVLNDSSNEVKICRFLYELLSINGSHGQHEYFLKYFIKNVLKLENIPDSDLRHAHIGRETLLDNSRRIDLTIDIKNISIAIEVKIYSGDRDSQLYDYYHHYKKGNNETYLYYLTLDGHSPSSDSIKDLNESDYKCISFKEDIINWIDTCIYNFRPRISPNLINSLDQFKQVLLELCNLNKDVIKMEIGKLLLNNSSNLQTAFDIENALKETKIMLLKKVILRIKEALINANIKIDENIFASHDGKIDDFYSNKYIRPSINVLCLDESITGNNKKVYLKLEIEDNLYYGFAVTENGEDNGNDLDIIIQKKLRSIMPNSKNPEKWWIAWEYVYLNNEKCNFRNFNKNVISLADEENLNILVNNIVIKFKQILEQVNKVFKKTNKDNL